jgi:hypothetical protein
MAVEKRKDPNIIPNPNSNSLDQTQQDPTVSV